MSRARHKHRAEGGKAVAYNAQGSNVLKEAHEMKKGGAAMHHGEGEHAKKRHDRPARGRARGGRMGAEKVPLSSAAKIHPVVKGELPEDMGHHKRGGRIHHRD